MDSIANISFQGLQRSQAKPAATTEAINIAGAAPFSTPQDTQAYNAPDVASAERLRANAIRQAAQSVSNSYVVSDKRFTIFKDLSGQYITRFTSLRDGKITYMPEPQLLNSLPSVDTGQVVEMKV